MAADRHIVHDPAGPDLEFEGELLVEEQNFELGNVKVYRTQAGKYVVKQTRHAAVRSGRSVDRVGIFEGLDDISRWLGFSAAAKQVLEKLGHPVRKRIE